MLTILALSATFLGFGAWLKNNGKTLTVTKASKVLDQPSAARFKDGGSREKEIAQIPKTEGLGQDDRGINENYVSSQNGRTVEGMPAAKFSESSPKVAETHVFTCGARTRKGTPCSRRVKGGERCWQHKGQPAMLLKDDLTGAQ